MTKNMLDEIILDLDGVVYDWEGATMDVMVRDGLLLAHADRTRDWTVEWMTPECWAHYPSVLEDVFTLGRPLPYALDGVSALRTLTTRLHVVTGGEPETEAYKLRWLEDNGVEFDEFTLVPRETPKSHLVSRENTLAVDDRPDTVDEFLADTPAKVIVYDQRYNRGKSTPKEHPNSRLFRAYSWSGVYRISAWLATRVEMVETGDAAAALTAMTE